MKRNAERKLEITRLSRKHAECKELLRNLRDANYQLVLENEKMEEELDSCVEECNRHKISIKFYKDKALIANHQLALRDAKIKELEIKLEDQRKRIDELEGQLHPVRTDWFNKR